MTRKVWAGLMVLAGLAALPPGLAAQPDSGAYLAARAAGISGDFTAAATYFTRALVAAPADPMLLENALGAWLGLGETERALGVARAMQAAGAISPFSSMVLAMGSARDGDWQTVLAGLDAGQSAGDLVDALTRAWAHAGAGDMDRALPAFDVVIEMRGMLAFGLYHKALALASVGDFEGAEAILSLPPDQGMQLTRRAVMARAQVLSQLGRNGDAVALIDAGFGGNPDLALRALRDRLAADETLPFVQVTHAAQGLGEVYYSAALAVQAESDPASTLFYARAARVLNPDLWEAQLLAGQMLDRLGRYDLANTAYAAVPSDNPSFVIAEIGRAGSLRRAGQAEVAVEVLTALARDHGDMPGVMATLADTLRGLGRDAEAATAYGQALALYPQGDPALQHVYFALGISLYRLDDWPGAEAAFRASLAINPDQPGVLNYLGYSMVEKGERLDEALTLIQAAVRVDPQNGAIVDSLGWALFRLGRAVEAVPHMEQAAALLPTDAVINDHLGDVYWAVGRQREAAFQWRRALSFDPTEAEATRIRRKLEIGLDAVLAEDGAPPLAVAGSDG